MTAHARYRRWKNRLALAVMALMLVACLAPLASLLATLVSRGLGALSPFFLYASFAPVGERGGIGHAIAGSLCLLGLAWLFSVPLGMAKGIYLAQRGDTRLAKAIRLLLDVMAGIPAIIVGVFIYTILVRPISGYSMVSGGLALGMIMLPIFARTTEEALRAVPRSVDEAGLALGLPRRQVILRILLRSAMPAVVTGMFLALARVAGEAAPLLFTAFGSNEWPQSLLKPAQSLPQLLFDYARSPFEDMVRQAWGAALVLVALILGIRLLANWYLRRRFGEGGTA